jgi:hypothetical protein
MDHQFIPTFEAPANSGAMSVDEFCRWARIGRTKAYAEAKAGRLLLRKIGAKTVIRTEDAQAWLAALPLATSEA